MKPMHVYMQKRPRDGYIEDGGGQVVLDDEIDKRNKKNKKKKKKKKIGYSLCIDPKLMRCSSR